MANPIKCKCRFLQSIDLFGKEPEFYFKGKGKKSSFIGRILTIFYLNIYVAFFLYKLVRMLQKVDVTFYDTIAFTGEPPSIKLTNENFYGGFALADANTLQPFIDPTIYNIQVFFRIGKRENGIWKWSVKPVPIEICQLEKFSEKYQDLFKDKPLSQMYCPKEVDMTLEGHTTYDSYSFFYVGFYPCVNTSTLQICKSKEELDKYLKKSYVSFKMQDIELTPQIYHTPIKLRAKEVSSPVWKNLYQNINSYFKIINIETDNDIVGFEGLSNIKTEKYLKYDSSIILNHLNDFNDYQFGQAIGDVTIQLAEQVLTIKRTYTKLIEVLGDVGGLMEVLLVFFKIISALITGTLYEKSLINNLFEFDIAKKEIIFKEQKNLNNKDYFSGEEVKVYLPKKTLRKRSTRNSIISYGENALPSNSKLNEDDLNKNKFKGNEILFINKNKKSKKKKKKINYIVKSSFSSTLGKYESNELKSKNIFEKNLKNESNKNNDINNQNNANLINENTLEHKEEKIKENEIIVSDKRITKIKISKLCTYFCFFCVRKRKNIQNVLLDEGMKLIIENLDIINIFKKLYKDEKIQEKLNKEKEIIKMSDNCQKRIKEIFNSFY